MQHRMVFALETIICRFGQEFWQQCFQHCFPRSARALGLLPSWLCPSSEQQDFGPAAYPRLAPLSTIRRQEQQQELCIHNEKYFHKQSSVRRYKGVCPVGSHLQMVLVHLLTAFSLSSSTTTSLGLAVHSEHIPCLKYPRSPIDFNGATNVLD